MKKRKFDFLLWDWRNFVISAIIFILVFFYRTRTIKIIFEPIGLYPLVYYVFLNGILLFWIISIVYSILNKDRIKKPAKMKNKFDKYFFITWRKAGIAMIGFVIAVVLHNLIYALLLGIFGIDVEEPVFFLFANVGIPLYFIVSVFYSSIKKLRRRK